MNLLLLLSALLSALTGVGGGVRGQQAVQAVAERSVTVAASARVARAATIRPLAAVPTPASQAPGVALAVFALRPVAPIFASRRRE